MILAQDCRDLVDGIVGVGFGQGRTDDLLQVGNGQDPFLDRCVGGDDQVVLVHTHAVVTLAFEDPHDAERNRPEADHLPHGILSVGEEFVDDGLPYEAYLCRGLDVLFGEGVAVVDPVAADLQIVEIHAVDRRRGVVRPVNGLPGAVHRR